MSNMPANIAYLSSALFILIGFEKLPNSLGNTREPLNNSAQAWMGRVVPFFGDVQASL